jgi:hypothetical protein
MSLYTESYETEQLWVIITTDCPTLALFMNVRDMTITLGRTVFVSVHIVSIV